MIASATGRLSMNQCGRLVFEGLMRLRGLAPQPLVGVTTLCFDGNLDDGALARAINDVVQRHDGLRIRFPDLAERNGRRAADLLSRLAVGHHDALIEVSAVTIDETARVDITRAPAGLWSQEAVADELVRIVTSDANTPFDISRPPLLRATLFPGDERRHLLVLMFHHLVSDRASLHVFREELAELYQQHATRGHYHARLQPAPRYTDFAERQWATFRSTSQTAALRYWKDQYLRYGSAHLPATTLSIARSTAGPDSTGAASECMLFDEAETRDISQAARRAGVTLHMFALAACSMLLQQYARRTTLALWGYASNRTTIDAQRIIGWLANTTLLGVDVEPADTVSRCLERVRRTVCSAVRHQNVPVFAIWLHMALESSASSVQWPHDGLVSFDTYPLAESRPPRALADGVTLGDAPQHVASPLQHVIRQPALALQALHGNRFGLLCGYNRAWFDARDVRCLVESFARIVRRMSRPESTVAELLS